LRDDADILEMIAQKLQEISTNNIQLTSILFLHKITENRFTGSNKRLQRVFAKVCGHDAFRSVVLATTMWDELREESVGARREKDLIEGDFWGRMVHGGTDCVRLYNSQKSANWLAELLAAKTPTTLQMQTELQKEQGLVVRTSAGRELDSIYTERIQPREKKDRSDKLHREERDELERLRASQYRLRYTVVSNPSTSKHFRV
jgi:mRNA-degrading endonuclease RelE of RelBE toxin-antitoxin system